MITSELGLLFGFTTLMGLSSMALLLGVWRSAGRPAFLAAWAGYCGLGGLAAAAALAQAAAPSQVPEAVRILLANSLLLVACGLLWSGARRLRGAAAPWPVVAAAPALWLAACAVPAFYGSLALRILLANTLIVLLYGAALAELLRWRRDGARPFATRALAGLIGLAAAVHGVRVALLLAEVNRVSVTVTLLAVTASTLFVAVAVAGAALAEEIARQREAAVQQAGRAEVERLLGGLPAVIFLRSVAPDGTSRALYRGGDLRAVLGWPPETFAGHNSFRAFSDTDEEFLRRQILEAMRAGQATAEWRMRQPDGRWRRMRTLMRPLLRRPDGSGEVVGYILDVTAEREAEARSAAAGRLASLGEMAAGLAHELRQPLAIVALALANARRAVERGDLAAAGPRLERAATQIDRAATLIEHLRRFSRGDEPGGPPEAVPVAAAVEGALTLVGGTLREAEIALDLALDDPPPVVLGQLVPLEQVLVNLLGNARDAMAALPAGSPRRLRIAAAPDADGMVRIEVADTGGGIAPEVMPRIFEPFVSTKGPDSGTGLGLSICHGLMTAMGGSIAATNAGAGAVVTLRLPAATPAARAA